MRSSFLSSSKQIKYGAVLGYILLGISTLYGLFSVPFILNYVQTDHFGVYKSVASIASALAVVDFGLGATMTRYISKFSATGEKDKTNNFIAMVFIQFFVLSLALAIISFIFYINIGLVFNETYDSGQISLAKSLFAFLILNMALSLLENLFFGIVNGNERFVFSNSLKILSIVVKALLIVVLLPITKNIILVVLAETIASVVAIGLFVIYSFGKIGIRPRLKKWDMPLFKESFIYTLLAFIQTVILQFSGSVDNILIGAIIGAVPVAVYSIALTIYAMYQNLSSSISNLMLPRITKKVENGATYFELEEEVKRFSRFQFFILAAALGGIICLGKDFYSLWLGKGYEDCYYLTIILVFSITLPTIINSAIAILKAMNKMVTRTIFVAIACAINVAITIPGILILGYWGAAIGTALSSISLCIMMGSYYHRLLKFSIFKLYIEITFKTVLCAGIPTMMIFKIKELFDMSWWWFVLLVVIFMIIYGLLLYFFSMNSEEKNIVFGKLLMFRKEKK